MDVYLLHIKKGIGYHKDDVAEVKDCERDALERVAELAAPGRVHGDTEELESIYKISTTYGTMTKLVPTLEKMRITLKPEVKEVKA